MQLTERRMAGFFAVLALAWLAGSLPIGLWVGFSPGPGLMPLLYGFGLFLSCCWLLAVSRATSASPTVGVTLERDIVLVMVASLAYIWFLGFSGYAFATTVLSLFLVRRFFGYSWPRTIVVSLIMGAGLALVFERLLGLTLPHGIFGL